MPKRTLNPTLPLAFAAAVVLHAIALPLVLMWGGNGLAPWEADLSVVSLETQAVAKAGDEIRIKAELRYEGTVWLEDYPSHRVWLSHDRQLDHSDEQLPQSPPQHVVGQSFDDPHVEMGVTLPIDADGPYQMIFEADNSFVVHNDNNRANNTRATPIYITGNKRPELVITDTQLPSQAIAGGTTLFSYTVHNHGPGYASTPDGQGGWRDAIYLSTDTRLDENDLPLRDFARRSPLAPGEDYAHQRVALNLPRITPGNYHLILVTDADQVLDQPSFTAGYFTQPIELLDTNKPDLVIASITAPFHATLGEPFDMHWQAANLGSVDTDAPRHDAVYLSRDDALDATDELLTVQAARAVIVAQSRSDEPSASITIPNEPQFEPGDWHLIVVVDDGDEIDEGPFENNNAFAIPITLIAPRDENTEPDLGEPDNAPKLTVAWIQHERIEQHMARLRETIQPAIQNVIDPDPNAPLALEPKPPALPAIALQQGGAPNDPTQPVDPNDRNSARPMPPVTDASDTNIAPRPLDPNAVAPEQIAGLQGNNDDLPMPRTGEESPAPDSPDNDPLRPDVADRDDAPVNPGDRTVESDAAPDAPDTDSETDSQTPAQRDSDTDETNPDDNDSDQPAEVMQESEGEQPNDNDPSQEPAPTDGEADQDDDADDAAAPDESAEQDSDKPEGDPVPPSNPSEEQETTRAPRDDAEADPTDTEPDRLRLEEGNVLVGQGVRVNTSRIRRGSATSILTATPRDTLVRVVFNNEGRVVQADIVGEGTGYQDWDARLLEALYRWTATGPDIDNADPHFTLQLEYQFGLLNRRD